MKSSQFRIMKSTYYSNNKAEFEEYTICMNSREVCSGVREDIEELYEQLTVALYDHKEAEHEKTEK